MEHDSTTPAPVLSPPARDPDRPRSTVAGPRRDQRRESFFKRRIAPLGAAILALLAKLKTILLAASQLKLLATAGTMLVSIAAYATIWGFWFALGLVVLLLVHELGHVIALRREGIRASAPMFVPFLGAVISARSLGDDAAAEARVGLAGPILGSLGAAACLIAWHLTGADYWRALAFTGFFLNLFNLLPVLPLDGGRAMAAMAPWMWFVGFAAMVGLAIVWPNPVIFIIVVFAARETWRRWKARRAGDAGQAGYYRVAPRNRALVALVYLGLIALLVLGMDLTHLPRTL
ncbi:MAG: site-2 protease family protein [Solirubrobacterales bacterium]|nr:site-2 protease family protein [Solirubrobacterales bacterium]